MNLEGSEGRGIQVRRNIPNILGLISQLKESQGRKPYDAFGGRLSLVIVHGGFLAPLHQRQVFQLQGNVEDPEQFILHMDTVTPPKRYTSLSPAKTPDDQDGRRYEDLVLSAVYQRETARGRLARHRQRCISPKPCETSGARDLREARRRSEELQRMESVALKYPLVPPTVQNALHVSRGRFPTDND